MVSSVEFNRSPDPADRFIGLIEKLLGHADELKLGRDPSRGVTESLPARRAGVVAPFSRRADAAAVRPSADHRVNGEVCGG